MASRSYVVGIPLVVEVDDDGVVTYHVDASEISSEMSEHHGEGEDDPSEEQMLLDSAVVDAHLKADSFQAVRLTQQVRVSCPVRYGCKFETASLDEMATHIETFDHSDADKF